MSKIRAGTCPSVRGILVERSGTEVRGPSVPGPHVIHGYVATNLYVCPMSQKPPCVSLVSRSPFVSSFRPVFHCYIPRPLVIYMYTYTCIYIYIYTRVHTYIHTYMYIGEKPRTGSLYLQNGYRLRIGGQPM